MDEMIEPEDIAGAKIDLENIRQGAGEDMIVTPRSGLQYKSLPMVSREAENRGGFISAPTLTALQAIMPSYNWQLARDDSTGDEYRWNPAATPNPAWEPTGRNFINDAKVYTDYNVERAIKAFDSDAKKNIEALSEIDAIHYFEDLFRYVVGVIERSGNLNWFFDVLAKDFRTETTSLSEVESSTKDTQNRIFAKDSEKSIIFEDVFSNEVITLLLDGRFYIPNMKRSVQEELVALKNQNDFSVQVAVALNSYATSAKSRLLSFLDKAKKQTGMLGYKRASTAGENGSGYQKIPAILKTSNNSAILFFNRGINGYNGDFEGAELYRCTITWDSAYNITRTEPVLFYSVKNVVERGIVKHATLGNTNDGRLILLFEVSAETTGIKYVQYISYSSDNGQTWSNPIVLDLSHLLPVNAQYFVLGTGSKVIRNAQGRLLTTVYFVGINGIAIIYSDDNGSTWQMSNVATIVNTINESSLVILSDNSILITVRDETKPGYKQYFKSTDNGLTVSYVGPSTITSPHCQSSINKFSDGTLVVATPTNPQSRSKFQVLFSFDDGQSWTLRRYQYYSDVVYAGYSSIEVINDDLVLVAVEGGIQTSSVIEYRDNIDVLLINLKEVYQNGISS
ncbi:sialidase family protein [Acinetobacter lactucae]|uniref:exo-alpha-sialidase n=1 Tax=Acinetobacter lactucae TaxID=1785128 RepID=A0AB35K4W6_9GAMM|nr:sialidase family protein [Acinetobacter lactucae]MDD9320344.1 sialidase family protein [Acinetobacter lactucae]